MTHPMYLGLLGALLAAPMSALAGTCPATNVIDDPEQFAWTLVDAGQATEHYVGTMEIGEATLEIGGETITTRVYRQAGGPGFGIFDFFPLGLIFSVVGIAYVVLVSGRLLPSRSPLVGLASARPQNT